MSKVSNLLSDITAVDETVSEHDLESSGGGFINSCGVYPVTIQKAFMSNTKKGGVQLDLHFGGANSFNTTLYIVSMDTKTKKKKTTCQMGGKTVSLPDFKMFKQLMFVATGKGQDITEVNVKAETIKYKNFGTMKEVEAETLVDLIGKEIQIGVRLSEEYGVKDKEDRIDENDYTDKTVLKTNQNGDVMYKKSLESVFTDKGFDPMELMKEADEPKAIESKKAFLSGDKAIKRVVLEASEAETVDEIEEEDEIDF